MWFWFPERSLPILALVIFLRGATRDQLELSKAAERLERAAAIERIALR
jgi:hypothetical protein